MAAEATSIRIPAESAVLMGVLEMPASVRGLIVLANAGANDSYAAHQSLFSQALHQRGYGTLAVDLLTPAEEVRERTSGSRHLDVSFLAGRMCLVLGAIRCHPACRPKSLGVFAEGMAAAGAIISASHHREVRAIVAWNSRADLAGDALTTAHAPTLLLASELEPHVLDLNRQAAARLGAIGNLEILETPGPGILRDRFMADRAADWFDAFVAFDDAGPAKEAESGQPYDHRTSSRH